MQLRTLAWRALAATGTALALIPATAGAYQVQDDQVATSFDGTEIVYTMFAPDNASASNPVPAVMRTHGWGGSRETTPTGFVQQLLDNGYAVLTWDSRGFGESGGTVEIDSPDFEARDASALIDVLAADPRDRQEEGRPAGRDERRLLRRRHPVGDRRAPTTASTRSRPRSPGTSCSTASTRRRS